MYCALTISPPSTCPPIIHHHTPGAPLHWGLLGEWYGNVLLALFYQNLPYARGDAQVASSASFVALVYQQSPSTEPPQSPESGPSSYALDNMFPTIGQETFFLLHKAHTPISISILDIGHEALESPPKIHKLKFFTNGLTPSSPPQSGELSFLSFSITRGTGCHRKQAEGPPFKI